jgi:hypothetical protein
MGRTIKDITGQRFGRLVALYPTEERCNGHVVWRLRCDDGKEIEIPVTNLRNGTQSCGCLRRERAALRCYRHGDSSSTLYNCWRAIKQRCLNPKNKDYKNYGGRGITITLEWVNNFPAFRDYVFQSLGPCPKEHTLDRIDNDRNYEPGNLRWAPRSTQNRNRQNSRINKILNE